MKNLCYGSKFSQLIPYAVTSNRNGERLRLPSWARVAPDAHLVCFSLNGFRVAPVFEETWEDFAQVCSAYTDITRKTASGLGVLVPLAFTALVMKLRTKPINFSSASNTGASAGVPALARSPYFCHAS